jgi:hypothetical protein
MPNNIAIFYPIFYTLYSTQRIINICVKGAGNLPQQSVENPDWCMKEYLTFTVEIRTRV